MVDDLRWAPHRTFGLRAEWVALYLGDPEHWQSANLLGPRQVSALQVWLATCGIEESKGMPSVLAHLIDGQLPLLGWELAWANAVFSLRSAWFYIKLPLDSEMTTRYLADQLARAFPSRSVRTIWDGVLELVGTLERTPIGTELGQGIVSSTRPRTVRRVGLSAPYPAVLAHAMRRLFQRERRPELPLEEDLVWPWVVFGCDRDEALLNLEGAQNGWLQVGPRSARLLIPWEELDGLALF